MYTYKRFRTSKSVVTILVIVLALAVWGALGLTGNVLAEKPEGGGGGDKTLHFSVTFKEDGGERIMSDGYGPAPYTYYDGEDNVLAIAVDQFRFDNTKGSGKRTVTLDFSGTEVEPLFGPKPIGVEMDMRLCFRYTEDPPGGILDEDPEIDMMDEGETIQMTMCIHFSYNGIPYGLAFGNLFQFDGTISQGTDPVTVRRGSGEEADEWTIEATPNDPPDPSGVKAALHLLDWKNGNPHYGDIDMPFLVTLVEQPKKGGKKAPPAFNLSAGLASAWGRIKAER